MALARMTSPMHLEHRCAQPPPVLHEPACDATCSVHSLVIKLHAVAVHMLSTAWWWQRRCSRAVAGYVALQLDEFLKFMYLQVGSRTLTMFQAVILAAIFEVCNRFTMLQSA